ncbi:MAG: hypothetical protein PHW94_08755 [Sulfurimonas sp.]|nr:hypothetical protein [Sulfurimonas sp.]MDD3061011.1 hypothetical protein [Sulfurimonas sp.]
MKKILSIALMSAALYSSLSASNFSFGVSGSEDGVNSFSLSIGDYYRVPVSEVVYLERSIPQDDLSVVYYLADRSRHSARYISELRLRGQSWWDISLRLGLDPYTVYGDGYGHPNHKKQRWHDHEIVDYVNTRFISKYHRISRDEVLSRRHNGERYMQIDKHYRYQKPQQREERYEERGRGDKYHEKRNNGRNDGRNEKSNDKRNGQSKERGER